MMPDEVEQSRRQCEARDWLKRGYTTPDKVAELRKRIAAKRSPEAAERLVQDMRDQWKKRDAWYG